MRGRVIVNTNELTPTQRAELEEMRPSAQIVGSISIPKPTPDQEAYLRGLKEQQDRGAEIVRLCKCRWGGRPGDYAESRKTCPVHKNEA